MTPPGAFGERDGAGAAGQGCGGDGRGCGAKLDADGRRIRNGHLAGDKHPKTEIPFDKDGYPDFKAAGLVKAEVKIALTGSRELDRKLANEAMGYSQTPRGHEWHHHQDGTTMQLVPEWAHRGTGHTGGFKSK